MWQVALLAHSQVNLWILMCSVRMLSYPELVHTALLPPQVSFFYYACQYPGAWFIRMRSNNVLVI